MMQRYQEVYINERDVVVSLSAFFVFFRVVSSWIERRKVQSEKVNLMIFFDKYLFTCLDKLRFGFKKITSVFEVTVIQMILYLFECLFTEKNASFDFFKEFYEFYFVFVCFWVFGGVMFQDQVSGRGRGDLVVGNGFFDFFQLGFGFVFVF